MVKTINRTIAFQRRRFIEALQNAKLQELNVFGLRRFPPRTSGHLWTIAARFGN
jgi:hypothetical protein